MKCLVSSADEIRSEPYFLSSITDSQTSRSLTSSMASLSFTTRSRMRSKYRVCFFRQCLSDVDSYLVNSTQATASLYQIALGIATSECAVYIAPSGPKSIGSS